MSDENPDDEEYEVVDYGIPMTAFREPTNLEIARLMGLHARDIFANVLTVLKDNDLLTDEAELNEAIDNAVDTSSAIVQWWVELVDDPEFNNLIKLAQAQVDKEDEEDNDSQD